MSLHSTENWLVINLTTCVDWSVDFVREAFSHACFLIPPWGVNIDLANVSTLCIYRWNILVIFVLFFRAINLEIAGLAILIRAMTIIAPFENDAVVIRILISFFIVRPVHDPAVITTPLTTSFAKHCVVGNECCYFWHFIFEESIVSFGYITHVSYDNWTQCSCVIHFLD